MFRREFFKNGILGGLAAMVAGASTKEAKASTNNAMAIKLTDEEGKLLQQATVTEWIPVPEPIKPAIRLWKLGSVDRPATQASAVKLKEILSSAKEGETLDIIWGPDIEVIELGGGRQPAMDQVVDEEYCVEYLKHSNRIDITGEAKEYMNPSWSYAYSGILPGFERPPATTGSSPSPATTGSSPLVNRPLGMNGISNDDIVKSWQLNNYICGT